jgi:Cu(I)/Ag(I) efflux system periplasmic protein CusF
MMKLRLVLTGGLGALALAACGQPAPEAGKDHDAGVAHESAASAPAALVKGRGEVVVLQPEYGAVTLRHEAIPEYGMGAMTMEFTTDPARLQGLKVGDKVTFELKGATEIETIAVEK